MPDEDFFDAVEAEGESFMAVCPWKGQIEEPEHHNPVDMSKPEVEYKIDWVYGYKCQDARQNVFMNAKGGIVYPSASLGIVQNAGVQKYFGGGEAVNERRNEKNNINSHNDDITCLSMSCDRSFVVTGQRGPSPILFTWDAVTAEKKQRF
jgi:hypothetical protein